MRLARSISAPGPNLLLELPKSFLVCSACIVINTHRIIREEKNLRFHEVFNRMRWVSFTGQPGALSLTQGERHRLRSKIDLMGSSASQ
jgi:hypothetical protein